ncbi:MAG: response regulator transcription factor [Micrococcales bacterium]
MVKPRILIVDDEVGLATEIAVALKANGYLTRIESNGATAFEVITTTAPDLVLLDIMLPGMDGLEVGRRAMQEFKTPVIFMTARDTTEDKLAGLNLGADDYVTKPILIGELLLRVRAVLRRVGVLSAPIQIGELVINEEEKEASWQDELLSLTNTELRLLSELARSRGRVLSKNYLLTQVWGYDAYDPNLVEVHVSSLRKKLTSAGAEDLISTKRGVGYLIK